jgi:hypothetical protein
MNLGYLKGLGLVVAGVVVGALASVTLAGRRPPGPKPERGEAAQAAAVRQADLDRVEARLRLLESRPHQVVPAGGAPVPSAAPKVEEGADEPTPEAGQAEFWDKVRRSVDAHIAEPADPAWAARTSASLSSDLTPLAEKGHFRVASLDCRTTTCLAKLDWPAGADVRHEYGKLLHEPYRANCTRSFVLEQKPSASGEQEGLLLFDCESWRADGEPVAQAPSRP